MAVCASMFSMRMIRILLENNRIPFALQAGGDETPNINPVTRVTEKSAPTIIANVDSFSELPKKLQEYLLSVSHPPTSEADRVKGVILGGKESALPAEARPAARKKARKTATRRKKR